MMKKVLISLVVLAAIGIILILQRQSRTQDSQTLSGGRKSFQNAATAVSVEGQTLKFNVTDATICQIEIREISEVKIHTTDEGPQYQDMFWDIGNGSKSCVVENNAPGFDVLFDAFKALKDFSFDSYETIAKASGSGENATFRVWANSGAGVGRDNK
jgi:hypothetical protein